MTTLDAPHSAEGSAAEIPEPYTIVSSDMHIGPSVRGKLREYCEAKYLRDFDEYLDELENQPKNRSALPVNAPEKHLQRRDELVQLETDDPHVRARHLDEDGIAAEVIYHGAQNGEPIPFSSTGILTWSSEKWNPLEPVGIHIYNRWLADFVSVNPDRHVGTAHIPIHDVAAAVEEVQWARSAGLRAVNLPAPRPDFSPYTDPVWEPFWAACAESGMVMNTHSGGGDIFPYDVPTKTLLFFMEFPFYARRSLWQLALTGVFARHPSLKLVLAEQFSDWIPEVLEDFDSLYHSDHMGGLDVILPESPVEYWKRNCAIGASFMSHREVQKVQAIGEVDRVMWGADYPHVEGTWPNSLESIRYAFHDSPVDVVRKILGENAIDIYGFDKKKLSKIAAKIGPTVDEVAAPLDRPDRDIKGWAFRERGKFS